MKVFKIVLVNKETNEIRSYFQGKVYEVGKEYSEEQGIRISFIDGVMKIDKGLHCYSRYLTTDTRNMVSFLAVDVKLNDGSYVNYYALNYAKHELGKLECIIPKDTTYYLNEKGEIVTDKIIVKEVLPFNDRR